MSPPYRDYIFVNQPVLLKWVPGIDVTSVTTVQARYDKPSGATGYATLTAQSNGSYTGLLPGTDVDEIGQWTFRAWLTVNYDANPVPGRLFRVIVHALNEVP